ncbi:hypothetical protein DFH29DRAFT_926832 [Suillus ampliporus]|nr:hypothetical protein DFH29DRAFT_926832 [Suillus ampliporus]
MMFVFPVAHALYLRTSATFSTHSISRHFLSLIITRISHLSIKIAPSPRADTPVLVLTSCARHLIYRTLLISPSCLLFSYYVTGPVSCPFSCFLGCRRVKTIFLTV